MHHPLQHRLHERIICLTLPFLLICGKHTLTYEFTCENDSSQISLPNSCYFLCVHSPMPLPSYLCVCVRVCTYYVSVSLSISLSPSVCMSFVSLSLCAIYLPQLLELNCLGLYWNISATKMGALPQPQMVVCAHTCINIHTYNTHLPLLLPFHTKVCGVDTKRDIFRSFFVWCAMQTLNRFQSFE